MQRQAWRQLYVDVCVCVSVCACVRARVFVCECLSDYVCLHNSSFKISASITSFAVITEKDKHCIDASIQNNTNCAFSPQCTVVAFRLILVYSLHAPVMPLCCFNDESCL